MKVGIFCDTYLPINNAVAIRLKYFVEAFAEISDIQVTVHTSTHPPPGYHPEIKIKLNFLDAPSSQSGVLIRLTREILLGIESFFRVLFCRYDLILITSPPFITSYFLAFVAVLRRIRYIYDVRDEYPQVYFEAGLIRQDSMGGSILLWLEKFIYRHAFQIITVTEGIVNHIKEKCDVSQAAKIILVRNGYDEIGRAHV